MALALVTAVLPTQPTSAQSGPGYGPFGDVNLLFSAPGTPAFYGANRLVRIEAGNINFVRACPAEDGGFVDWFQPAADLYIVPAGWTTGGSGALSGRPRTVFGGLAGQFFDVPLLMTAPAGPLGSGTYDVIVDECQDGRFNPGVDSIVRDAFRVDAKELVPGFEFEAAEFQRMKAAARATARDVLDLRRAVVFAEGWEAAKKITSVATSITSVSGFLGFAVGELADLYHPNEALKQRGKAIVHDSLQQRMAAAANLAADPPDHQFQAHAPLERGTGAIASDYAVDALDDLFLGLTGLDQLGSIEEGFLTALERYQGAQLAGNPVWALRHARTLQRLAAAHAQLAPQVADDLHDALQYYRDDQPSFRYPNALQQAFSSLAINHPTSQRNFWNSGADLDTTVRATDAYIGMVDAPQVSTFLAGNNGYAARAQAGVARIREHSAAMNEWADAALGDLVAELEDYLGDRDIDPTAVIASIADAPAGGTVTLDASGSLPAPGGTPIDGWDWDLDGDGVFDDASGATPSWQVPGDAVAGAPWVIGLRVTAGDGEDVVHLPVTITEGNRRPELVVVEPGARQAAAGDTVTFEVASATDPDGDPVTLTWLVEDEVVEGATGMSHTLELPDDTFGTFRVEVIASDPGGARVIERWGLDVRNQVDADRDGYYAWPGPDCDDSDQFVNPAYPEILNNGKDDDCNPDTPDEGDGRTGHPSQMTGGYYQGVAGDLHTVSVTGWNHAQRYNDLPFTITVEWPDGTSSQQTVQGTTYADTVFELEHTYSTPVREGSISYCITYSGGLVGCNSSPTGWVHVVDAPPIVGAADLRTWPVDREAESGNCYWACDLNATWSPADPDGRTLLSTGNPNEMLVAHSPVELSEDGYGRAMVQLSTDQYGGDDDNMGFVLGYQSDEVGDGAIGDPSTGRGTADFIGFTWGASGRSRVTTLSQCSNGGFTVDDDVWAEMATVWRQRGLPLIEERWAQRTFDFPPAEGQDPRCHDDEGVERLAVINPFPEGARVSSNRQTWLPRGMRAGVIREAPLWPLADPYVFEIDYRPDRLQIWMDGQLIADLTPSDPDDPFPPGAFGVLSGSNPRTRVSATAPELAYEFVQGTPGPITMPFHDGNGPDDSHTAIIDWGDGAPQSTGIVTADPDTGFGWFEVTEEHAYHLAGEHRGEVCVTDSTDKSSCFTFRASVENLPPVVDAGPSPEGRPGYLAGGRFTIDQAVFHDPGLLDTHTATIDWGDGTTTDAEVEQRGGGGSVIGTHDYTEDGTYTIEVCVTDQGGLTGCDTVTAEIRATNVAPVALLEVTDGVAGVPTPLGVGFTDHNPNDTHTMTYDAGDGSGPLPVPGLRGLGGYGQGTVLHTYATPGTYTVTACVSDQHDATDCISAQITIAAGASTVTIDTVDPVDEGASVTFTGTVVHDDEPAAPVTVTVDPGDGSAPVAATVDDARGTFEAEHVYRDDGTYTAVVTACTDVEPCGTATTEVEVRNVVPTVDAGRDRTSTGLVVLDDTTFTDPGLDDTHTATVDWADGDGPVEATATFTAGAGTVQASHTYTSSGARTVEVCVTDDDGGTGCDDFEVTVLVGDPSIQISAQDPDAIDEGSTVTVPFTFTDADGDGPYTATVRWSDGSAADMVELDGTGGTASHRYLDDGVFGVTIEVCDGDRCGLAAVTVTVDNVAPTVATPTGGSIAGVLAITASFVDPGELDHHTATVNWGDGTTAPASVGDRAVTASHTYAEAGSYRVEVCVTDDAGDVGCAAGTFVVTGTPSAEGACPDRLPRAGYRDTVGNTHERAIDCITWYGLARGRTPTAYDPGVATTREQMASFLVRLLRAADVPLPAVGERRFTDLTGGPHDVAIAQLTELGIVQGRTSTEFAPRAPVRRDQMASFIVRTYEHVDGRLPASPTGFGDIAGNTHERNIRKAETAGFALGRTPTRYEPAAVTQRDQMASFLARMLEELAVQGHLTPPDR